MKHLGILFISLCFGLGSCKSNQPETETASTTVLVQVFEDDAVTTLENDFKAYELAKEKVVSSPMHIYLFTFNTNKITDTALIKLLKKSDLVKEAQQNRNVQLRKEN